MKGNDYALAGAYFLTICADNKACIFGNVKNGLMQLNEYGRIIEEEWLKTSDVRHTVTLDCHAVMPNHFHGILVIQDNRGVCDTGRIACAP